MKIHFVCMGNVYRSRFAEAYARSRSSQHEFSSSGVNAEAASIYGPISWWGARLAYNYEVAHLLGESRQSTSQELLQESDLVIFLNPNVKEATAKKLDLSSVQYNVWNAMDIYHIPHITNQKVLEDLEKSDHMAEYVTERIDTLLKSL